MTDYTKYELILSNLALGMKQSDITLECKCSYGTITRAKKWAEDGKLRSIRNKSFSQGAKAIGISIEDSIILAEKSSSSSRSRSSSSKVFEASVLETKIDELSDKYLPISSSEFPKIAPIPVDVYPNITYNSRFLSWMGAVLKIDKYWDLSKNDLKNKIIKKISKI